MPNKNICCAVIAAAGSSSRMGEGSSKQFLFLNKIPVIVYTLRAFDAAQTVDSIVVVCRQQDAVRMKKTILKFDIQKVSHIFSGGNTRQKSVAAGIAAVPPETDWLIIHDGDRPFISPELIDGCVRSAYRTGASALAVPVKDTVKSVDRDRNVVSTLPRENLWAVQTPQVFRKDLYLKALREAECKSEDYTDDCQLLEHAGIPVHLCMGSYDNIKLTVPEDIPLAEMILKQGTSMQ
jgi:2-C-methyl-D-erythritol 4-phosphate cytidylyltransferase